jgi:FkbM family methyltransferase
MRIVENIVFAIRHHRHLEHAEWFWSYVRPIYGRVSTHLDRNGLERIMNGTDRILLSPQWRMVWENYEPEVWHCLMSQVRSGDIVADVGAYIGLYTIALAQRVGPSGCVVSFEPDARSFESLKTHADLNAVSDRVDLRQSAVGDRCGSLKFNAQSTAVSSVVENDEAGSLNLQSVDCTTLDSVFENRSLDILKIDVEGYEERVLLGGIKLLSDATRSPRVIFIEVHPYAWEQTSTTSESLLGCLSDYGYDVRDLDNQPVHSVEHYGEIVAHKRS